MQYSNVAGKQKSNDVYRYPAELTSGKVRRLKFETVTDAADTDIFFKSLSKTFNFYRTHLIIFYWIWGEMMSIENNKK